MSLTCFHFFSCFHASRFLNPIKNGVHKDASKEDAKLMKGRIYALKKKVEGFVQRKGIETLVPYLPNRFYFVIGVRLSPWQRTLYQRFLQSIGLKRNENGISLEGKTHLLFKAYCELAKVTLSNLKFPSEFVTTITRLV